MRNKFLGTGEPGYHPLRKVAVVLAGLRCAALHDFSGAARLDDDATAASVTLDR